MNREQSHNPSYRLVEGVVVVRIPVMSSPSYEEIIDRWTEEVVLLMEADRCKYLLIDFAGSEFIFSFVLGKLIRLYRHARSIGGVFKICGVSPLVMEVFQITRLNHVLDVYTGPPADPELVNELFRDSFPSAALPPSWLSGNDGLIPKMARVIDDEQRFEDLPILADALEEAGCDNAVILDHCRQAGEHGRGCWLVNAILGMA